MTNLCLSEVLALDCASIDTSSPGPAIADAVVRAVMGRRGSPVGLLELLVTLECNHECDYCFIHGKRRDADMPMAVASKAIDFLLHCSDPLGIAQILPFGGEPLLRFDLICEIVEYAEYVTLAHRPPRKVSFSLTTNGTLLDQDKMAFFRDHGIMVLLSLDGNQATHDRHRRMVNGHSSYTTVVDRLHMIKAHQPWLGTRMTVHPDAVGEMVANFEHMVDLGINQFIIGPSTGIAWTADQWEAYEEQMIHVFHRFMQLRRVGIPLRVGMFERDIESMPGEQRNRWGCGAGRGRMTVAPDGCIYPCSKLVGIDALQDTHKLGDVWAGVTNYQKRGQLFAMGEDRPKCRECALRDDCAGGCPATNYEETGSLFLPSWLDCAQTRLMVRLRREVEKLGNPGLTRIEHIRPLV